MEKKSAKQESENADLKKKSVEQESENTDLKKKSVEQESENSNLEKKLAELAFNNADLKKKSVRQESEKIKVILELKTVKEALEKAESIYQSLKKQLRQLNEKLVKERD